MSSVPTEVNCSFPKSLCFKYSNKSAKDGQFTALGCISAELCRQLDNRKGLECCHGDLCNTGEARKTIKIEALITVWMQCSIHGTQFSLTSRSVVLEPSGNNNFHNKAQSALWLVEKARMLYESLKDGAKAVTPCQYSLFYVSYSPYTSFVPLPERFTTEQSTIKASLFVKCSDGRF